MSSDFGSDLWGLMKNPGNDQGAFGLPSIGDSTKAFTGQTGAEASLTAARENLEFQREALDYLKEQEELPSQVKEQSLSTLRDVYAGNNPTSRAFNEGILDDPFYKSQIAQAQEGVMRHAAAKGGAGGGSSMAALARVSPTIMQSMRDRKLQGLQNLALGVPSNQQEQANLYSKMGDITAMGGIGAAQSLTQGSSNLAGLAGGIMKMFSDPALKDNAVKVGETGGLNVYKWDWNEKANNIGLSGSDIGFMANEVEEVYPDLVIVDPETGYKQIKAEIYDAIQ